jgi:hypothetical protein
MMNNNQLFDIAERDEEEEIKEGDVEEGRNSNLNLIRKNSQMQTPGNGVVKQNEIPGN